MSLKLKDKIIYVILYNFTLFDINKLTNLYNELINIKHLCNGINIDLHIIDNLRNYIYDNLYILYPEIIISITNMNKTKNEIMEKCYAEYADYDIIIFTDLKDNNYEMIFEYLQAQIEKNINYYGHINNNSRRKDYLLDNNKLISIYINQP